MAIKYKGNTAVLKDVVSVEEAEGLLEWIHNTPKARIDMSKLVHIHTACLQVLMASNIKISSWPKDELLKILLEQALKNRGK